MIYENLWAAAAALLLAALVFETVRGIGRARRRKQHEQDVHVFLDLETLSIKPDGAIMVIAAHAVDYLGRAIDSMQVKISRISAEQYGATDPATVKWWGEQSEEAVTAAFLSGPRFSTHEALAMLNDFIAELPPGELHVWGNAPTLDCVLLRYAYDVAEMEAPWPYYCERDCRTLADLSDFKQTTPFEGTPHIALDDAKHQARYTMRTLRRVLRY